MLSTKLLLPWLFSLTRPQTPVHAISAPVHQNCRHPLHLLAELTNNESCLMDEIVLNFAGAAKFTASLFMRSLVRSNTKTRKCSSAHFGCLKAQSANNTMDVQWLRASSNVRINVIHPANWNFSVRLHEKLNSRRNGCAKSPIRFYFCSRVWRSRFICNSLMKSFI